jgi:hypothetical protein
LNAAFCRPSGGKRPIGTRIPDRIGPVDKMGIMAAR